MTDLDDDDNADGEGLPALGRFRRFLGMARMAARFVPTGISIGCAVMVGYFTYIAANPKPAANVSTLAVSILKSADASPEMRDWAADALGIQTGIGMPVRPASQ